MQNLTFAHTALSPTEAALQAEVRSFATRAAQERPPQVLAEYLTFDLEFSQELAARGWTGMFVPERYGGSEGSAVERWIVAEELLAAQAPCGAHWVADRQVAPSLLKYGSPEQCDQFLPAIAAGTCSFAIGMSEPDSGSDLASVRTAATRDDGGWILNGTKTWTSQAHLADWFIVLSRTSVDEGDRHHGLSQFIVDLRSPGISINPISMLDGSHHFNEVVLDDVFVPDSMLLGEAGMGWAQVTSELGYERAGPERYLSTWPILQWLCARADSEAQRIAGRLLARMWTVRRMSLAVARSIDQGASPAVQASLVKDIGTRLEQDIVTASLRFLEREPALADDDIEYRLLTEAILTAPSFTIRGGTNEILRTIIAKGLRR